MTDEKGEDAKVLAVPVESLSPEYKNVRTPDDVPTYLLTSISHFFEHYKDLEEGKWVKIEGWAGVDEAQHEIRSSMARYEETCKTPA